MIAQQFCTYFDARYFIKGRALYRSLRDHTADFVLWVLCLDEATFDLCRAFDEPNVRAIKLAKLEAWEPRLPLAQGDRSRVEYFWTCTPTWVAYVLDQQLPGTWVSYLDSDLFFFSPPEPIFQEAGGASVIIHGHRFAPLYKHKAATSGIYNVGLTAFRSDPRGWQVLRWWQDACLQACYLRPALGYCGDQKYLDDWKERFQGVHVLEHPGAGLAPWNIGNYHFELSNGDLTVDGRPLIFYHFHAFQMLAARVMGQRAYDIPPMLRRLVYARYARALQTAFAETRTLQPEFHAGWNRPTWNELRDDVWHGRYLWI